MTSDVVLFGTGSLARSIAYNLATTMASSAPLHVLIVGRRRVEVEEVAFVARGRAGAAGTGHAFEPFTASWANAAVAGEILHQHRPVVAIVAASEQSPWELARDADAWGQLVKRGGFGVTLPLNASLVSQVFRVANGTEPRPFFINACYPDAVNSLLAALGPSDRLVGVGNAAIIESLHRGAFPEIQTVRVVAHHRHLGELSIGDEGDPPVIYADGDRVSLTAVAVALRGIRGMELNWVTGASVSRLIDALVADRPFSGSLPGPLGEIGGYPVTVARGAITIDLPTGLSITDARDINARAALREGVVVRDGAVHFSAGAREALMEYSYPFADGFAASSLPDAVSEMRVLRERLRRAPPKKSDEPAKSADAVD
jgi:hypothetical protein